MAKFKKKKKTTHIKAVIENRTCPECDSPICSHVIKQLRHMEGAMLAAQDAIKKLDLACSQQTIENVSMQARLESLKKKADKKRIVTLH